MGLLPLLLLASRPTGTSPKLISDPPYQRPTPLRICIKDIRKNPEDRNFAEVPGLAFDQIMTGEHDQIIPCLNPHGAKTNCLKYKNCTLMFQVSYRNQSDTCHKLTQAMLTTTVSCCVC